MRAEVKVDDHLLEQALIDIANATDASGLKIMLHGGGITPRDFRRSIIRLVNTMHDEAVWLHPDGERTCARNLGLLVRGWRLSLGREDIDGFFDLAALRNVRKGAGY